MARKQNRQIDKNRLIALRKGKGMTQKELAEKSGVSESTIKRCECGKGFPDAYNLLSLSKCLRCDPEYLTGESEYINTFQKIDIENADAIKKIKGELQLYSYFQYLGCEIFDLLLHREPTPEELEAYHNASIDERDSSIFADFSLINELETATTEFIKQKYAELLKQKEGKQ